MAFFVLRAGISIGLLWLIMRRILFLAAMGERIVKVDPSLLVGAALVILGMTLVFAVRCVGYAKWRSARWGGLRRSRPADGPDYLEYRRGRVSNLVAQDRGPSITHAFRGTILDRVVGSLGPFLLVLAMLPFFVWTDRGAFCAGACGSACAP